MSISTLNDTSAFQRDLLRAIGQTDDATGTSVCRTLEMKYSDTDNFVTLNHSRLYQNLDKLVDAGLVQKTERNGRSHEYLLTASGHEYLMQLYHWCEEVKETA